MSYTSEGLDKDPDSGYYVITTSMSILGWIKLLSKAFLESPLYPIKQCSFTLVNIDSSWISGNFFRLRLVFAQTISSQRLKPHYFISYLASYKWSVPAQRNKKEGLSPIYWTFMLFNSFKDIPILSNIYSYNICCFIDSFQAFLIFFHTLPKVGHNK